MTYDSLSISEVIPAPAERIYAAWLSSDEQSAFTGDKAVIEPFVGGKHSAFDGYSFGQTVELQPGRRIVQTWRAEDFPLGSPDSRVEVTLEETVGGTMVTILHTEIPSGQGSNYRDGWLKYYLEPLKSYFVPSSVKATNGVPAAAPNAKAKARKPKAQGAKKKARAAKARRAPKAKVRAKASAKAKPRAKKKPTRKAPRKLGRAKLRAKRRK